jgi:hypothetical protein
VRPPDDEEAAALVAAAWALLAAERAAAGAEPELPPQYRSAWRRAALTPEPFDPTPAGPA